jgi:hypothetical protein
MKSKKGTKTPEEVGVEINMRLSMAGHRFAVGAPRVVRSAFATGRNWDLEMPAGLSTRDRDVLIAMVRRVGNEFDCEWKPRRRKSKVPRVKAD